MTGRYPQDSTLGPRSGLPSLVSALYLGELGMAVLVLLGHFCFFFAPLLALKKLGGVLGGSEINGGTHPIVRKISGLIFLRHCKV